MIYTYHCLCTELVLASTTPLTKLPTRTSDRSIICPLPPTINDTTVLSSHHALLHGVSTESSSIVVEREDGFEKRYLQRCPRCNITVGYQLDKSMYKDPGNESGPREDVVYLLPGGLVSTEDMMEGKNMEKQIEFVTAGA